MSNGNIQFGDGPSYAYETGSSNFVQHKEAELKDLSKADSLIHKAEASVADQLEQARYQGQGDQSPQSDQDIIQQLAMSLLKAENESKEAQNGGNNNDNGYDSLLSGLGNESGNQSPDFSNLLRGLESNNSSDDDDGGSNSNSSSNSDPLQQLINGLENGSNNNNNGNSYNPFSGGGSNNSNGSNNSSYNGLFNALQHAARNEENFTNAAAQNNGEQNFSNLGHNHNSFGTGGSNLGAATAREEATALRHGNYGTYDNSGTSSQNQGGSITRTNGQPGDGNSYSNNGQFQSALQNQGVRLNSPVSAYLNELNNANQGANSGNPTGGSNNQQTNVALNNARNMYSGLSQGDRNLANNAANNLGFGSVNRQVQGGENTAQATAAGNGNYYYSGTANFNNALSSAGVQPGTNISDYLNELNNRNAASASGNLGTAQGQAAQTNAQNDFNNFNSSDRATAEQAAAQLGLGNNT